jgi:hypothetical protein
MNKIISFSIFGQDKIYLSGLLRNIELASKYYPEWRIWVYAEKQVQKEFLENLESLGVKTFLQERKYQNEALFWRFNPALDDEVDIWVSRDADSRISLRESEAVREWTDSGATLHSMRDSHNHSYPIMAGMLGFRNRNLNKRLFLRPLNKYFGLKMSSDQQFLSDVIWSRYAKDSFIHDHWATNKPSNTPRDLIDGPEIQVSKAYGVGLTDYVTKYRILRHPEIFPLGVPIKPFPTENFEKSPLYVGQVFNHDDQPRYSQDARWEYELRGKSFPLFGSNDMN